MGHNIGDIVITKTGEIGCVREITTYEHGGIQYPYLLGVCKYTKDEHNLAGNFSDRYLTPHKPSLIKKYYEIQSSCNRIP